MSYDFEDGGLPAPAKAEIQRLEAALVTKDQQINRLVDQLKAALDLAEKHMNEKHALHNELRSTHASYQQQLFHLEHAHDKRVTELLGANNKYLDEAREARRLNKFFSMFNPEFMKIISLKLEEYEQQIRALLGKRTRIRHYKGGEYLVDAIPVKVQISQGMSDIDDRPGRLISDGDELIVYRMLDGSMAFGRFPDEMLDPARFTKVSDDSRP